MQFVLKVCEQKIIWVHKNLFSQFPQNRVQGVPIWCRQCLKYVLRKFPFFVVIVQVIIWYSPTSLIQSTIFSFKLITMPACQGLLPILNALDTNSFNTGGNYLRLKQIFYISELFRMGKSWSPKFGFDISNYYWRMT